MPMTKDDADMLAIDHTERHLYVRYDDAKANLSPLSGKARWFKKHTVELDNATEDCPADHVGALVPWSPPDAFDGVSNHAIGLVLEQVHSGMQTGERYTASTRGGSRASGKWVGCLLIDSLGMSEAQSKTVIKAWLRSGVLVEDEHDCPVQRRRKVGLFAPENARPGMTE